MIERCLKALKNMLSMKQFSKSQSLPKIKYMKVLNLQKSFNFKVVRREGGPHMAHRSI